MIMAPSNFTQVIGQYQQVLTMFLRGNPEQLKQLWSHKEDVSLLNPFGTLNKGWKQVTKTLDQVSSQTQEGEIIFEMLSKYETSDLAYIVEVEKTKTKLAMGKEFTNFELRVTTIFRRENDDWKIVHRHADQLKSRAVRPVESLKQR